MEDIYGVGNEVPQMSHTRGKYPSADKKALE
jgi:hypothetical protein